MLRGTARSSAYSTKRCRKGNCILYNRNHDDQELMSRNTSLRSKRHLKHHATDIDATAHEGNIFDVLTACYCFS